MKIMRSLGIFLLIITTKNIYAQIILEHSYPFVQSSAKTRVELSEISENVFKYIYVDYQTNELKIFNMDHTPYLSITIPVILHDDGQYVVGYITKSLFDCDTSMIEYAIMPGDYRNNFYVFREDGTLLFERDSTIAPYCFGCFSGSYDVRPIVNTSDGTKLFLSKGDTSGYFPLLDVYSLCGTLPLHAENILIPDFRFVEIFPNPNNGTVNFRFDLPSNVESYSLSIYDQSGRLIKFVKLPPSIKEIKMDFNNFSQDEYMFNLSSDDRMLQSGKILLIK